MHAESPGCGDGGHRIMYCGREEETNIEHLWEEMVASGGAAAVTGWVPAPRRGGSPWAERVLGFVHISILYH